MSDPSQTPTSTPEGQPPPAPQGGQPPPAPQGSSGLAPNVAGALAYLLGALTGILFLVIDRDRPSVRFHAMQSILVTVAWVGVSIVLMIVSFVLGAVPLVGWLVSLLLYAAVSIGAFALWLYLMYRAYQGDEWEVPFVGEHARRLARQA